MLVGLAHRIAHAKLLLEPVRMEAAWLTVPLENASVSTATLDLSVSTLRVPTTATTTVAALREPVLVMQTGLGRQTVPVRLLSEVA